MLYFFPGWELYLKIYVALTIGYLWYRFGLLFLEEARGKAKSASYNGELISVIIPFYNEDPGILQRTIQSVLEADGNKEVIVVDDGSPSQACTEMVERQFSGKIAFERYSPNRGKRLAQKTGFRHAKGRYLVTVDSDTVVNKDAFTRLLEPFGDEKVGATTGNVQVLNENANLLTKLIASRYWNAFNVERKSLSGLGLVTCCSGVLSAYRAELFARLLPSYTSQRFLGEECTFGDDRHLTNLVLMNNYSIHYVPEAICKTQVPTGFCQFIAQQLRWKKSFLRESLVTLGFAFRRSAVLPVEVLLNLLIPLLSLPLRISILATMIIHPPIIPAYILTIMTVAIIRNFFLIFENKKMAAYSIPYAFVHEFCIYWLYVVAIFTIRRKGWGTR